MADGTTIDDLQISIDASADNANHAIDNLVKKLDKLQTSLSKVNGSQLTGLANGVDRLGKSMQVMNTIKTADFTRLATNLTKLGSINVSALNSSASSLSHLSRALNTLNGANFDNKNLQNLINSITRLSNANVGNLSNIDFSKIGNSINQLATSLSNAPKIQQSIISMTNAVSNLSKFAQNIPIASSSLGDLGKSLNAFMSSVSSAPSVSENVIYFAQAIGTLSNAGTKAGVTAQNLSALGVGLVNLMTTLSKAPNVNKNIIDMTNALANLATQGAKVGSASKSIEKGLNRANNSATRASKSFGGLASAIGKFYATYFMVIRGIKGLYKSIEGTADYLEAFNYFNVALGKIGSDWSHQFEQYGYESAEAYADSFSTRLQSSLKNLSGLQISVGADGNGLLTETGLKNLGLNIQEITQYASQLASVTNSVGQVGEVSLAAANSLTKLGADLSSLFNLDYSSVMNNLQSGLIGQSRALYKYGIDITNATLQTYAYELGLEKAVSEMTQAEKMQLRLIAILDQSKVSWGDLANTINSPSNMIRQFKNNLKEVGMVLGQLFIPLMQKVMPVINGVTIALKRLLVNIAGFLGIQLDLSSFGQGYSGLGEDVDGLTDSLDDATASAKKLKSVTLGIDELNINAPQDTSGASTGGVGGGIDLTDEILTATSEYEKVWEDAFNNMENKAQEWANRIEKIFEPITNPFENLDWKSINKNLTDFLKALEPWSDNFGEGFIEFWGDFSETSSTIIKKLFGEDGAITYVTDWLNDNDPKKAKDWGYAFGELVLGISAFATISTSISLISKLSGALSVLLVAITAIAGLDLGKKIAAGFADTDEEFQEIMNFTWFGEDGFFSQMSSTDFATHFESLVQMARDGGGLLGYIDRLVESLTGEGITLQTFSMGLEGLLDTYAEVIPLWYENDIKPWLTKEKWTELAMNIPIAISNKWQEFTKWWETSGVKKWFDEKVKPWFTKEKWIETLKSIPEAFKQSFKDGVNISINFMNKLIDGIEDMVNNAIDGFSELVNSLNPLSTVLDFVGISFDVQDIDLPNIPMYEVGGYPKSASLFWANENGVPELVGNIGNQTAVASGTEITGISTAIYDTAQEEIALLREQNNLLMELLRKDMSVNIGDREIARANARGQKSLGYALIT